MAEHAEPSAGMTCLSCWDDVDQSNYVEYRSSGESAWMPSGFCEMCITYLVKTQWELYTSALAKTTCKAEQRRLLKTGPPINLRDVKALPCPDDGEVHSLWFMSSGVEQSAKLEGSLVGEVWCLCSFVLLSVLKSLIVNLINIRSDRSFGMNKQNFTPKTSQKMKLSPPPILLKVVVTLQSQPQLNQLCIIAIHCFRMVMCS